MSRRHCFTSGVLFPCASALAAVLLSTGCSSSSSDDAGSGPATSPDSPRLDDALYVDLDGNGPDADDVVLLRFSKPVVVQGASIDGFETERSTESFGTDAVLRQALPGSDRVEIVLGDDPELTPGDSSTPGVTRVNIARSGAGIVQVTRLDDPEIRAGHAQRSPVLLDVTASAPVLVEARLVDVDGDGLVGEGDRIVASFQKPVRVPPGASVTDNFLLPVSLDSFGASPVLEAASGAGTNRSAAIILGAGAAVTLDGGFSAASAAAGAPSGLRVAVGPTITDTLASSANTISPGVTVDVEGAAATLFGNGRDADSLLGTNDAFAPRLTAQGLDDPAGVERFAGTLAVGDTSFSVDLLFVADRGNDRVLVFEEFPSGSFAAASWVLGQPDFRTATSDDPPDPESPAPTASNLSAPSDVAFDADSNRLFVSDTGHHRVLVWDDVFTVDPDTGAVSLENGQAASFTLGQASLAEGRANRGLAAPSATSLSAPGGIDVSSGRLIIADTGNHRVVVFGSLPQSPATLPSTVLGQASFTAGEANRGGAAGAGTLSSPLDAFFSGTLSINGSGGAVLIADTGNHRVLVFETLSPASGASASVALGQVDLTSSAPALAATRLSSPSGVVADPTSARIYVADQGNHRVMTYSAASVLASGAAGAAIGQVSAVDGSANRGGAPGAATLSGPSGVEVAGTALVVADSQNHRVLVYEGGSLPATHRDATQVVGQSAFSTVTANGRRFNQPTDALAVEGRLIVSDTANHRILIYSSTPLSGDPDPDVVLGQADLFSSLPNRGGSATAATLNLPTGLATDGTRLAAADTGNHRVLIWSSIPSANGAAADVVLGQSSAAGILANAGGAPSASTFHSPEGIFVDSDRLLVADRDNNRVLIFAGFSSLSGFAPARNVLGQRDLDLNEPNRGESVRRDTLRRPRDVLVGAGNLYVADTGNHRVLVWDRVPSGSGSGATGLFGQADFDRAAVGDAAPEKLAEPSGLAMDPGGELLLVSDTAHHRVLFFDSISGENPDQRSASGVLGQTNLLNSQADDPSFMTLENPRGIFFNGYELFAADAGASRVAMFR